MDAEHTFDLVFLALARDCEGTIPAALRALESYDASGLRVHMIAGENGSKDATRALLEHHLVTVVDTSAMGDASDRLQRMAVGRQIVADRSRAVHAQAFAVVDLDEPFLTHVSVDQVKSATNRLGQVFAVAATSVPTYYDLLAFDGDQGNYVGLEATIREAQKNPRDYYALFRDAIYPAQDRLTSSEDIACRSAFNGLAIYSANAYRAGSYLPVEPGPWICEHVTFNRSIAESTGLSMVIDAGLVLPMPAEHGRRNLAGFIWQRAKKAPAKIVAKLVG